MFEFLKSKQEKKLEVESKAAVKEGSAVPTIRSGLEDKDMFPFLLAEVHKFSPEEKEAFKDGLARIRATLDTDSNLKINTEVLLSSASVTLNTVATLLAAVVAWISDSSSANAGALAAGGILGSQVSFAIDAFDKKSARARLERLLEELE